MRNALKTKDSPKSETIHNLSTSSRSYDCHRMLTVSHVFIANVLVGRKTCAKEFAKLSWIWLTTHHCYRY